MKKYLVIGLLFAGIAASAMAIWQLLKSENDEKNSEKEEVAQGSTETGQREAGGVGETSSGEQGN